MRLVRQRRRRLARVRPGCRRGQRRTGYRADGPWDPARGLRCNPAKLLLDPYARAITGEVHFGPEVLGYAVGEPDEASTLDSAAHVPRSVVVDPTFDWGGDAHPRTNYADTVFYEAHPKGLTALHPDVPAELRGTFAGLGHAASVEHLRALGVTTVSLLPVHYAVSERRLVELGLRNYWGYNTLAFSCLDPRLSSSPNDPTATRRNSGRWSRPSTTPASR